MHTTSKKTDNSHLAEKVYLREAFSPRGPLRVLDAYGGKGVIWAEVGKRRNIEAYTAIEKERGKNPAALCGDNAKILPRLDLSGYNVVDLDAYGIPIQQIETVLRNPTLRPGTAIFITAIKASIGPLPARGAKYINATPRMISKAQYLFGEKFKDMLRECLRRNGISAWHYYEHSDTGMHKIYCCCTK